MLALIVADRHLVGVVQQDVGRLEGGIREQAGRGELPLPLRRLVLELRHPAQLAEGDVALHDPTELAVLAHVALREHGGDIGVEPDGEEHRGESHGGVADDAGLLGDRERVEVDDAVEGVAFVLSADPVLQCAEVVAEMDVTGRLHAGQNPRLVVAARVAHVDRRYPLPRGAER